MFGLPDRDIAPLNNPTELGLDKRAKMEVPPEDWPATVTFEGSPLKKAKY